MNFPGLPLDLGNQMGEELMSKYKSLFISGLLYAFGLHDCKFLVTEYLMLAKQFAGGNI